MTGADGRTWVEYGLRVSCDRQGCSPRHADDGEVTVRPLELILASHTVNGHAADLVQRTITVSGWEDAESCPRCGTPVPARRDGSPDGVQRVATGRWYCSEPCITADERAGR